MLAITNSCTKMKVLGFKGMCGIINGLTRR